MTDEPRKIPIRDKRLMDDDPPPVPVIDAAEAEAPAAPAPEPTEASRTGGSQAAPAQSAEAIAADRLDQLMRLKADFENFRQRTVREQTELIERASQRIVERLLPVLDDFDRAIEAARASGADDALLKGIELVDAQLHELLTAEGVERIVTDGAFDPAHHEAVATKPGGVAEPTVSEVVRHGYTMKGRTIRPALVHVEVPEQTTDISDVPDGEG